MKAPRIRKKEKQRKKKARIAARKHAQGIADRLLGITRFKTEWFDRNNSSCAIDWKTIRTQVAPKQVVIE